MNEHHLDDQLRAVLDGTARDIELDLESADVLARRGRTRRTRRRVLGGCAVGALALAGVATLVGDDDSVQTADDGTAPSTLPLVVSDGDGAGNIDESATIVTTPPTLPATAATADSAVGDAAVARAFASGAEALLPWQDGFLAVRTEYAAQPLGPLPEEMLALFPQEVRDLFDGDLPPTVDEAMAALEQADLLDVVFAVLDEHPEVQEAIYAQEPSPPTRIVEFTTDGETWTPLDVEFPELDGYPQITANPTGITMWSIDEPQYGPDGRPLDGIGPRTLTIAHSTDLESWSIATLDVEVPTDDSEFVHYDVWPSGVAATADRWVAVIQQNRWIDMMSLLPADLQAEAQSGQLDWSEGPDGVEIYRFDADGNSPTTETLTWAELGIDPDQFAGQDFYEPTLTAYTGDFAGAVQPSAIPDQARYGNGLFVIGDTFYAPGEGLARSVDGATWSQVDGIASAWVSATAPLANDATLVIGDGPGGQRAWVIDADGAVTEATLPELPLPYSIWTQGSSAAFVVEASEQFERSWDPVSVTLEHDGYGVELTNSPDGSTYRVTELATGDEVWFGEYTWDDSAAIEQLYEYDDEADGGSLVFRDADGAEIVRVPDSVLEAAYQEAYPAEDQAAEEAAWQPDLWLIATTNGSDWLTLDLADPGPEGEWYPYIAAINGDRVLYQSADGWAIAPFE